MKKLITSILVVLFMIPTLMADIKLPPQCEAFMPYDLYKSAVLAEDNANRIASSNDYGQNTPPPNGDKRAWIVCSDRADNNTYLSPNISSGKHTTLNFKEPLRIAKIKNGFALVYSEPRISTVWPYISEAAVSKGWVPMDKLLLWRTCPVNDQGIYNKALLAFNLEEYEHMNTSFQNSKIGDMYKNPETLVSDEKIRTSMDFFFIMKRHANGLVLLARQCSLDGLTGTNELYGWVKETDYVPWNQRSCIEPNWDTVTVAKFVKQRETAKIYESQAMNAEVSRFRYGKVFIDHPDDRHRLMPNVLRYPILDGDNNNQDFYKCTTFGTVDGDLDQLIENIGDARKAQETALEKMKHLNLIVVIDGTTSMEPYFPAVKEAIKQGCTYFTKNYTPKVGLVIYRDYADGEGLVEYVPMSDPNDPLLIDALDNGGEYGIASAAGDRTHEEALFKGLEMALDNETMNYSKEESNIMLVIGDCGNDDRDTQCLSQEEIISRMVENRINLLSFQVKRQNSPAWNAFSRQMQQIGKGNLDAQYAKLGNIAVRWEACTDGYDLVPTFDIKRNFFIGSIRHDEIDKQMDAANLTALMADKIGSFNQTVEMRMVAVANGGFGDSELSVNQAEDGARMDSAFMVSVLGKENFKLLKESRSLIAFTGYTKKHSAGGDDYWRPVLFISLDEFRLLMDRLQEVERKARTGDRTPYVEAMKSLVRSMLPDITPEEMGQKGTNEIMALIAGLNEPSAALKGPSLVDIQDPHKVSQVEFNTMIANFRVKFQGLRKIMTNPYYPFIWRNKDVTYYWIPIDNLP